MGADQHQNWAAVAAATLDWWREAGVDTLVEDAPRDWLTPLSPAAPAPTAMPAAPPPDALPDTMEAFLAWRTGSGAPEAGWSGDWLIAAAPTQARVMVLADCPDRDDGPGGGLLSGASGQLFDAMLAAVGIARADVHLAATCAKRPIAGRLPPDSADRLAEIARHHVALAAPTRLLLLGDAASRAILGMTVREAQGNLHRFNHRNGQTGVVATFHPRLLIERPGQKAQAWKDLRVLMGNGER